MSSHVLARRSFSTLLAVAASLALASLAAAQIANCPAPSTTGCAPGSLQTTRPYRFFPFSPSQTTQRITIPLRDRPV